jgi:hypothetical protein
LERLRNLIAERRQILESKKIRKGIVRQSLKGRALTGRMRGIKNVIMIVRRSLGG